MTITKAQRRVLELLAEGNMEPMQMTMQQVRHDVLMRLAKADLIRHSPYIGKWMLTSKGWDHAPR